MRLSSLPVIVYLRLYSSQVFAFMAYTFSLQETQVLSWMCWQAS